MATGSGGLWPALDWLVAHINDPTLDREEAACRSYVLYLCPDGEFQKELQTFWDASRTQIGWNGAHNKLPHISLCQPFACHDRDLEALMAAVAKVAEQFRQDFVGQPLKLERYHSANFLGLFVGKKEEILLRSLCQALAEHTGAVTGTKVEPVTKTCYLTLAFQFLSQHFAGLEDLSASLDLSARANWHLRLYSSEERTKGCDVFKVIRQHSPREDRELELMVDDLVFVDPDEFRSSADGWTSGISWLTGCQGRLHKNCVEQVPETSGWTLHQTIPLTEQLTEATSLQIGADSSVSASMERRLREGLSTMSISSDSTTASPDRKNNVKEVKISQKQRPAIFAAKKKKNTALPRQVFICRHGERVDFTFGTWIPYCFDERGMYVRKDMNMPMSLPERSDGPDGFCRDSPMTNHGIFQARSTGEALLTAGVEIKHAFASPAFRCVQTCYYILEGMGLEKELEICVEPGLFEWLVWHQNSIPACMTVEELRDAGYNVDCKYKPYISIDELRDTEESCEEYYTRNYFVSQCILQAKEDKGGNILLVGHAASLDVCTRQLTGQTPRKTNEILNLVRKVPYCSLAAIEERQVTPSKGDKTKKARQWDLVEPPVPPMTECSNSRFDWKILLESSALLQQQTSVKHSHSAA